MKSFIKGVFKKNIYVSDKGYTIGLIKVKETNDEEVEYYLGKTITFTGYFDDLKVDETYIMHGTSLDHPRYGFQYDVNSYEKVMPSDKDGIIEFLSSDLFKGVGEKLATAIVEKLGNDALRKISENLEVLFDIPKLSKEKAIKIHEIIKNNSESHEDIVYLCDLGFTMKDALSIFHTYKEETIRKIENNIYDAIKDVSEITFTKIDYIALKHDFKKDDIRRIKACIIYIMNEMIYTSGDTFLYKKEIITKVNHYLYLNIEEVDFDSYFNELATEELLVIDNEKYYIKEMYDKENYIVQKISILLNKKEESFNRLDKEISRLEEENYIKYNELQKEAIKKAICSNVLIITGGPGTGKTTIIKAIVSTYKKIHKLSYDELIREIALLAPTGRASKRMAESTLLPASTIHRFLKWNKETNTFGVCENNKDKSRLIIVDESSMIDINLFDSLLKGLTDNIKLILVGDYDQLPSVGPGQILKDMIESNVIPTIKLDVLYRQDNNSYINVLAKEIKTNEISSLSFNDYDDYRFLSCVQTKIKDVLHKLCIDLVKHGYDYKRVQVMAPMYKGENGIDNLNVLLQSVFNPKDQSKKELVVGDTIFRVNDKILQLVNMPDENVFNGDIGVLKDIIYSNISESGKNELYVDYDGNVVKYLPKDFAKIKHGFIISVHKSQGGEFEFVILPVCRAYSRMLYRKLVYTAVTRARKKLVIVGEEEAFTLAVNNTNDYERKTFLKFKLINCIKK